jgi:2-polyprenyl-3-methyl-5-hydroxy-6-metoxy-1,4-benzoquinol methylase
MNKFDLTAIADNVMQQDGIWFSKTKKEVSYPKEGSDHCFEIEDNSYWFQHRNRCIELLVKRFSPDTTFFDIGGGNGFVSTGLQKSGIETVLIEPSIDGVNNAKKRGLNNLVCSTLEDASFKLNSLAAIGVFDVVEHIEDDMTFLKQLHSYLEPNGKLYITVPAFNFLWANDDEYAGHFRRYTIAELKRKLGSLGFEINLSTYLFASLVIPIWMFRVIPSKLGFQKNLNNINKDKSEHGNNGGILTRLIKRTVEWEFERLIKKSTIPFGSSCLVVVTKK